MVIIGSKEGTILGSNDGFNFSTFNNDLLSIFVTADPSVFTNEPKVWRRTAQNLHRHDQT